MTRKDYKLIAGALARAVREAKIGLVECADVAAILGTVLKEDNPTFDRNKFNTYIMAHIAYDVHQPE